MPVQLASFLLPRNSNTWYLLEDKYLKGGLQVVADAAVRNAINPLNRKAKQLVVTQDDGKLWQLQNDLVSWSEFNTPAVYNPFYTHVQSVPEVTWTVTHNKECRYFNYAVFDDTGKGILPDSVDIVDDSNITLSFSSPVSGHCTFSFDQHHTT